MWVLDLSSDFRMSNLCLPVSQLVQTLSGLVLGCDSELLPEDSGNKHSSIITDKG